VSRILERHKTNEGADGGQAQVARPDAGAALRLEIGQERAYERRTQIIERQGRRCLRSLACANLNSSRTASLKDEIVLTSSPCGSFPQTPVEPASAQVLLCNHHPLLRCQRDVCSCYSLFPGSQ